MRAPAVLTWCLVALCAVSSGLIAASPALAQAARPVRTPIDLSRLGPQIGQVVPDFSLPDQNGKTWTRASIMGSKGAMLVFFRSADW
jgi:hypothetical protein